MLGSFKRLWLVLFALVIVSIVVVLLGRNAAQKPGLCTTNGTDYSEGAVVRVSPNKIMTCHSGKWVVSAD